MAGLPLTHSCAPFSVEDDARVCEARSQESLGDRPHLIAEDTGENQPPARSGYSGNTRRRLDQDVAEEVGEDNIERSANGER